MKFKYVRVARAFSACAYYIALAGVAVAMVAVSGCAPAPRFEMSSEQKVADMWWFFSMYGENYAPLEYKESRYGFKWEELKQKYIAEAQATKTNEEFYKVAYKFVAEFHDAHNAASLNTAGLPARAKIAYLGFTGKRQGNKLRVTDFLPTSTSDGFPIKAGDLITSVDGVALPEIVKTEQVLFRNLGQDESNLTYHMPRIFTRLSTSNGLPSQEFARLSVERGEEKIEVVLPWVVKDLYVFRQEQEKAAATKKGGDQKADESLADLDLMSVFKMSFNKKGDFIGSKALFERFTRYMPSFQWTNTFQFVDDISMWAVELKKAIEQQEEKNAETPRDTLAKERDIPDGARMVETSKIFPAYTIMTPVMNAEGKDTGVKKTVTYVRLDTFSPQGSEDEVVTEIKALLKAMRDSGSNDLVIDMIDNGGGSLTLGMRIAQALSNKRVVMPEIQFRISNSWADEFEKNSLAGATDTERVLNGKVLAKLLEDRESGKRLSRRFPSEALMSWPDGPNKDIKTQPNIVLLVNEMCASMCDIFTAIMKDNNLVKVVGSQTMGAGGNVVNHASAPNSNMQVRQTESLIVRADGSYIENNGVMPDVAMAVNEDDAAKYGAVRTKAFSLLTTEAAKVEAPKPAAAPAPAPAAVPAADAAKPVEAPKAS